MSNVNSPFGDDPKSEQNVSLIRFIRNRFIAGLMASLPIVITIFIIYYLYSTLRRFVIDPVARLVLAFSKQADPIPAVPPEDVPGWFAQYMRDGERTAKMPDWFAYYLDTQQPSEQELFWAPIIAAIIVLMLLYFFGMFFQTRLHRMLDWVLLNLPGVTTIYTAVRNVVSSLTQTQNQQEKFKRVVLVKFPHDGMQVPAFVTSSCVDSKTGKKILCVYVPTTPVPTSGYMLMVPEEDVIELTWDLNETLQAIVSGGITVPEKVDYYKAISTDS